jgi:predicted lysophospholipase L1 biosynthesis ABC-type transport system permease subunit
VTAIAQVSERLRQSVMGVREFRAAIIVISVFLSFLVVLLAMYTAIVERTREIGILRAMGASQTFVVRLLLRESALICLAGIAVGFLLAALGREVLMDLYPAQDIRFTRAWAIAAGPGPAGPARAVPPASGVPIRGAPAEAPTAGRGRPGLE